MFEYVKPVTWFSIWWITLENRKVYLLDIVFFSINSTYTCVYAHLSRSETDQRSDAQTMERDMYTIGTNTNLHV